MEHCSIMTLTKTDIVNTDHLQTSYIHTATLYTHALKGPSVALVYIEILITKRSISCDFVVAIYAGIYVP